jgi:tetrahydromethanopterin:alpha-L-glutamate ligase
MFRIGIVTSDIENDWASRALLDAAIELADGIAIDPISFTIRVNGVPSIELRGQPGRMPDAFIMRGFNRQGEIDYQYEILELLEQAGHPIVNSTAGLSLSESKSQTTYRLREAGLPVPRTLVTQDLAEAEDAVKTFGAAVIKPLYGSFGVGIERIAPDMDGLLRIFMDMHRIAYIQEYIPNEGRDIRAFVVGDDVPAAMYRVAGNGNWKTNVFQGSSCQACELSSELREMCLEAAQIVGLDYTGVDVMEGPDGPVILELNGAPSWHGLSETTDRNMAVDVIRHVLKLLESGRSARQPVALRSR